MRAWLIATTIGLAACGGQATVSIDATFPMGPRQVRQAVVERFADVLAAGETNWPADQPETTVDLELVKTAPVTPKGTPPFAGKSFELGDSLVSLDVYPSEIDALELFVGPPGATDVTDPHVHPIAHAAVPQSRKEISELTWAADGPSWLAAAFAGKLAGQNGSPSFTLLARGHLTVTLTPGAQLPGSDAENRVLVDIPVRYMP